MCVIVIVIMIMIQNYSFYIKDVLLNSGICHSSSDNKYTNPLHPCVSQTKHVEK